MKGLRIRRCTIRGSLLAASLILLACSVLSHPALAADATIDKQSRLRALAAQFSQRIGSALGDADSALDPNAALNEKRAKEYDSLNDGEILLLGTTLREARSPNKTAYKVEEPISAMKQGHDAYISLSDFVYISGFAIKVSPETGVADGWYIDEKTPFTLDTKAHTITRGNITTPYPAADVLVENNDFYIKPELLSTWFDLKSDIRPRSQLMEITTNTALPLQERVDRLRRRENQTTTNRKPEKPRLPQEYHIATLPRADIALNQQIEKRGDGSQPNNFSQYSVLTSNQLLNHEMTSYINGYLASNRDSSPLQQVRVNFKKESETNDLLGPLAAKVYEFNDITPTIVPYTGGAASERGVRVSNQSQRYSIDTQTVIDGDAQPGWDVEVYRNNSFVGGVTVDDTGRYSIENVQLFAGDNRFRIVIYGPEGQQREETRLITVLPNLVGDIKGYYNASLSQEDTMTYEANPNHNEDRGTLRFAGVYDRRVSDNLTLRGGLHSRETQGQRDNYFYSGAVTSWNDAIINGDLITTSDGPYKALLTGRKRFGQNNVTAGLERSSRGFSDSYIIDDTTPPGQSSVYTSLNGPFLPTKLSYVTYDAFARVTEVETGEIRTNNRFGLNSRYMGMNFENSLELSTTTGDNNGRDKILTYYGGIAGRKNGYSWRSRLDYEITPAAEPTSFTFNANKYFDTKSSGFLDLRHQFINNLSTATVGMSYYGEKARVSPQLSVDSDSNLQAKVNVNFSVGKDPYSDTYTLSGDPISNYGGLSVFTFLDKDGNGVFDGDDEPLPDVIIDAVQYNMKLSTNDEGIAYSSNIPTSRVTDVVMEENSAFDPTWVPGYDGASIRVRPSEVIHMEFPVLRGAEMDGTAYISSGDSDPIPARSIDIKMITPDGQIAKATATPSDGFFVIEALRPGVYYLTTESNQSAFTAYRVPEKIVVTPEGAQIYGHNIMLTRGYDIRFTFSAANTNPALQRRTKILKPEDIAREDVYLRLGNYRSSLTATLAWYKFKLRTRGWSNPLTPVAQDFDTVTRDGKTGLLPLQLKPAKPLRMQEAAQLCERLVDAGFEGCGVDVVTTYNDGTDSATTAPAQPTKG